MQYALPLVLPDVPAGGVCAGIDWATADHAACVVDLAGRVTDRFSAAHDKAGLTALITRLRRNKVTEVAIERGGGPLVDALLGAGLTVVVITSRQVRNLRSRFGAAGAKDDRFDAFVLADTLRTDRARLRPLVPGTPATISLRMAVRARRDLVRHRVAVCNQLRAHLAVAFPAGITLFHDLDSPISLAFLARFGSQDAAAELDEQATGAWLATIAVRGRPAPASVLHARLHAAPPGATGTDGAAQAGVTAALTATLTALSAQIKALQTQISRQLAAHPDAHIFTSLPRPGTVRAARLLAGPDLAAEATRVQAAAVIQGKVLDALLTAERLQAAADPATAATAADCGCPDCRAATSPMAYLADLLGYVQSRVAMGDAGGQLLPGTLAGLLYQPVTELPVECGPAQDDVSQVRLVVESLERLIATDLREIPDVACGPRGHSLAFMIAADVDGDRQAELVIGFEPDPSSWLNGGAAPQRAGLWGMRLDRRTNR